MQSCEYWQSLIDPYLDGELDDAESESFLEHISSCPECEELLTLAKSVRSALSELPPIEVPADFGDKLHERIEREQQKHRSIITYSRRFGALAACIIIAVAVNAGDLGKKPGKPVPEGTMDFVGSDVNNATIQPADIGIIPDEAPSPQAQAETGEIEKTTPTKDNAVVAKKYDNRKSTEKARTEPTSAPQLETAAPQVNQEEVKTPVEEQPSDIKTESTMSEDMGADINESAVQGDIMIASYSLEDALGASASAKVSQAEDTSSAEMQPDVRAARGSEYAGMAGGASGSGGSGGTSLSKSAAQTAVGIIAVNGGGLERARAEAQKYCTPKDGIYTMSQEDFESFIQTLRSVDVEFENRTYYGENISFRIE